MDQKKKQLVLLGVVGALAIGAGGYFVFLRDGGGPRAIGSGAGTTTKKERQTNAPAPKVVKKDATARKAEDQPKATQKRVREEAEERHSEKKTRDTKDRKIEKKKVLPPAA